VRAYELGAAECVRKLAETEEFLGSLPLEV
jgi:hypothetical protein